MYIVLIRDIIHPESQDCMYDYASIIPVAVITELHETLGIDETLGHFCMTIRAACAVQNRLLAELETP